MDFSHPAFDPYRPLLARLPQDRVPTAGELNAVAQQLGLAIRFAESGTPLAACEYEGRIRQTGIIPTRPANVHDFMNALVWLTFPVFKVALNRAHCRALAENPAESRQRGPLRDALTVLDESGVLVFSRDPELLPQLANRRWHQLFVEKRQTLPLDTRFHVVGHAVLEKLLDPYLAITGKCLVIDGLPASLAQADHAASTAIAGISRARQLPPLPVAGIPGWHPDNHLPRFYDNTAIFRPLAH